MAFDELVDRLADALDDIELEVYEDGDDTRDDVHVYLYDEETGVEVALLLSLMAIEERYDD